MNIFPLTRRCVCSILLKADSMRRGSAGACCRNMNNFSVKSMAYFQKALASQLSFERRGRACWLPKQIPMTSFMFFPGSQNENSSIGAECTKCCQTMGFAHSAGELMPAEKGRLSDANGEASLGLTHSKIIVTGAVLSAIGHVYRGARCVRVPLGRSPASSMTEDILRRIVDVIVMEEHCHST